ncbi:glycosyl transferase group 1 [Candidatus Moduliflexus flocculans]|uniref:Glycosyl transferase group 1 n=1 Tax=Candidatus Moduliflexus flocculans TaxID=1499966 RepID=A0A0S6VVR8_9BACT|nr:glycosyl transferase group 1 [Candidatus Moduliflexus flocculans]
MALCINQIRCLWRPSKHKKMSAIRVTHISANDIRGGAARAAYRLHFALHTAGIASQMFVRKKTSQDADVSALKSPGGWLRNRLRMWRKEWIKREFAQYQSIGGIDYDLFTDDRSLYRKEVLEQLPTCDLINVHWIAKFIDYQTFFPSIARRRIPLIWTLHDMNPFTGGCHYDRGCGRFVEGCGKCPQLKSSDANDLSRQIWRRKQRAFAQLPDDGLHIVALCQWMAHEVRRSPLFNRFPMSIIPNGLDTSVFAPRDRRAAREMFQLPQDRKVVLFVAGALKDVRKGLIFLQQAIEQIPNTEKLLLVSVGKTEWEGEMRVPYQALGMIEDERMMSFAYSAADLFVIPSLQDNLPNTVMEAMACGVPVVGFDVGGIPDMVRPGVTGISVPPKDAAALGAAIATLLNQPERLAEMSRHCCRIAREEYDAVLQAKRYRELYDTLCAK